MTRMSFVLLAGLLAACAPLADRPPDLAGPTEPLVWPQPPETPRIKFLYGFREPADLGIRAPFFDRLWDVIAGAEDRRMVRPYAVAVDGQMVAVADPGIGVLHLFDTGAAAYRRIDRAGGEALISPVGVALAGDRIYLADSALRKVFVFDRQANHLRTFEGWQRPTGLAYDRDSRRLYVADTLDHRILALDDDGQRLFSFGSRGYGDGDFNFPTHLTLSAGTLYVNDAMNFRVQAFDLEGRHLYSLGSHGDGSGDLAQPKGIGVDREGHLYVADSVFDRVQIFDPQGRFLLAFGGPGGRAGDFWLPAGLFIADNLIYVADSYNRRVQVFELLGGA